MTFQPVLPWWLLLPLIAAAMAFLGCQLYGGRGKGRQRHVGSSRRAGLRHATLVLLLAGAALRPGLPGGTAPAASADLNVFFVVDTTTSMVAEDYGNAEPRMAGVRQDIAAIAQELPGARFSVITFDTTAHVRMPLTTDTLALETITSVLEPQVTSYAKGSSVTAARQVLSERLTLASQSHPGRPRLVYYFGDGEQTSAKAPESMDLEDGLVAGEQCWATALPAAAGWWRTPGRITTTVPQERRRPISGTAAVTAPDMHCPGLMKAGSSRSQGSWVFRTCTGPPATQPPR